MSYINLGRGNQNATNPSEYNNDLTSIINFITGVQGGVVPPLAGEQSSSYLNIVRKNQNASNPSEYNNDLTSLRNFITGVQGSSVPDYTSSGPDPTGIITVKTSYKDLGAGLGNGLEISLECDTERDITGFDLRFDETGQSSSWKYLKLENATHNAVTVNPSASGTVFDNNTDWYITNNSGNHPNDGLTRINGFTGESTNNSGTWTFNNKITITANVPLTLMKLLPGTNTDQNNLPQLVYADLVKTVGGELYNDDKDDNNASIVVIDTTAVVTPLAQSVIIQN